MTAAEEREYRKVVAAQSDEQIDRWASDLIRDYALRRGVGPAVAEFMRVTGLDASGFQRAFLVGGGPDHVIGVDTAGQLVAPVFELPRAIAGLRRLDPRARQKLIGFLVGSREVMAYTA